MQQARRNSHLTAAALACAIGLGGACGSESGVRTRPPEAHEVATVNNRAVAKLRDGVRAQLDGRSDDADWHFAESLASAEEAVAIAGHRREHDCGYAQGWANKAYALWKLGRTQEAAAAAREARRIRPSYTFHPSFAESMTAAGQDLGAAAEARP